MRTKKMDALAKKLADFLAENVTAAPRGVIDFPSLGCVVAFGNDGYAQDARVRREVELIRVGLPAIGLDVLGFGLSTREEHTWALIVNAEPGNYRHFSDVVDLVWSSWARAVAEPRGRDPRIDWGQVMAAEDGIDRAQDCPAWMSGLAARGLVALAEAVGSAPGARPRRRATTSDCQEAGGLAGACTLSIRLPARGLAGPGAGAPTGAATSPDDDRAGSAVVGAIRLFTNC